MRKSGSATEPLWYKDAVIYELSVKGFLDSNHDGIGDFRGLIQKLDYLQDLGVTCLWLLPFFPSPLRDDGYDIADYFSIHPSYGTLDDFRGFLDAAHAKGMQVMIELVINHTSDAHPWFQAARAALPGTPERDFYVWSDTDQKFSGTRIIFTDTEKSNWTWDPVAQAYYWHRFFSHQPDLNYDNPRVIEEVLKVMRYWLDMGVDALRLDAIPYLIEREGTNCENLPESHAVIKQIRRDMDEKFANRMILAEANQWPTDVRPYFGDGDECHMAFHFPLMPRLFMALRLEDRHPITEIMSQTPEIPENCQWGLFLRNHDELTLEMVSDEERDYMYYAYSADSQMRINVGIRRRLAPLMENNRRRIELLHSILFSFPGTPIIYYGDEIGMGDNIYLGDRDGVRTPMQWSSDRNAGFSRVTPAKLYSPVIMDPIHGYEAVNVEAQQSDSSSLLSWMRNMIALRKLFKVFGRGTMDFLQLKNRKVLAYTRTWGGETILCVANLSRFAQPVELDLSRYAGMVPTEMLGYVEFPPIRKEAYPLTLAPYGYLWFELQPGSRMPVEPEEDQVLEVANWGAAFQGQGLPDFESKVLPRFLRNQRWFAAKSKTIASVAIRDWSVAPGTDAALILADVSYQEGGQETYFCPLAFLPANEVEGITAKRPESIAGPCRIAGRPGALCDAVLDPRFSGWLLEAMLAGSSLRTARGTISFGGANKLSALAGESEDLSPAVGSGEQSNTSIRYGRRIILKLFRRLETGPNPDCELSSYLDNDRGFPAVPRFGGCVTYRAGDSHTCTIGMAQEWVPNQGDAWKGAMDELGRFYEERVASQLPAGWEAASAVPIVALSESPVPPSWNETMGLTLEHTAMLARRTAGMHLALAVETGDESLRPESLTQDDLALLVEGLSGRAAEVFSALRDNLGKLPDDILESAGLALSRRRALMDRFRALTQMNGGLMKIRVHGDYHLGQVLRVEHDYRILDFEGEPARPLAARRAKQSPLKDVAGMLRSFSYAAWAAFLNYTSRRPQDSAALEPWARYWEKANCAVFLKVYREAVAGSALVPADSAGFSRLLDAFLVDKALYELEYELNNRPNWVRVPLNGLLALG
jgi:maltose alpha-D-glucosyltransferase/alpha-amylase